jgi:predicted PhzF superfamily epimerase YddE/YHI9
VPTFGWLAATGLLGALACASGERTEASTGSLTVAWIGSDTGKLSTSAVAEWCDSLGLLELRAIRGDTGVAVVLYPVDSVTAPSALAPGDYRVVPPAQGDSSRPSAAIAMRWFSETSIRGFRGDSGTVVLEAIGPGSVAGRFAAYLGAATEGSELTVSGSFKGLSIAPASVGCLGRHPRRPSPPAQSDDPADITDID